MATDLAHRKYIRYDSGVTHVPPGELEDVQAVMQMFTALMNAAFDQHGRTYPVTHARTLGIVKGKLVVPGNLPQHLKQSFFAKEGEYPVVMRYSTQNHDVGSDDRITQFRALTIKIFNVDGDMFSEREGNRTQDFEFNSTSSEQDLSDAKTAREIIGIRLKGVANPAEAEAQILKRPDAELQTARNRAPNAPVESLPAFSQVPYRFGDYVAKHALIPFTETQKKLFETRVDPKKDASNVMSTWLEKFFAEHEAEYLWQFQLLENLNDQPVENSGVRWNPEKYPYQTVARLVFPKQDSINYKLKTFWEDNMHIDSFRGLKSLEPIGGSNRLRRAIYPYARKLREKYNGREVIDVQNMGDLP